MQIFDYTDRFESVKIIVTVVIDSKMEGAYQLLTEMENSAIRILIVSEDRKYAFYILKRLSNSAIDMAKQLNWEKQPFHQWAKRKTQTHDKYNKI